jgi:hypothetical protein
MPNHAFVQLGAAEEELEAACAAVATLAHPYDALLDLAAEHRIAAGRLSSARPRLRATFRAAQATVLALFRSEQRVLDWLRDREHRLLQTYLSVEADDTLSDADRRRLRQYLLPAAFARYAKVDALAADYAGTLHQSV